MYSFIYVLDRPYLLLVPRSRLYFHKVMLVRSRLASILQRICFRMTLDLRHIIAWSLHYVWPVNTLRPRQNGRRFADDTFKRIFLNENVRSSIKISLKFVPKGPINNNPALVQIMAWRRSGDKPLSEPMIVSLLTHICVTRPQWVNSVADWRCRACCQSHSGSVGQTVPRGHTGTWGGTGNRARWRKPASTRHARRTRYRMDAIWLIQHSLHTRSMRAGGWFNI